MAAFVAGDPRARVQPARRDHQPAAAVSRTLVEPAPVVGRRSPCSPPPRCCASGCSLVSAAPLSRRYGEERVLLAALVAARRGPGVPGGAARLAALPRHGACVRGHRADERAAAEPGQAAPAGPGGTADRGLPAQPGRGGDPRLADSGAAVPGVRWVGPARPGDMGPAGGSGGAGVAAAMALPDGAGRSPAARAARVAEGIQTRTGLAGHGLHGSAKPDLLRNALLAPDAVPGQGSGPRARGHAARGDESR